MPDRKWVGVIPVLVALVFVLAVYSLEVLSDLGEMRFVYEPPFLLAVLNGVFVTVIPLVVAYLVGRSFLDSG